VFSPTYPKNKRNGQKGRDEKDGLFHRINGSGRAFWCTRFHVSEPTTSPQEETAAGGTLAKEAEKVHQKALRK